MDILLLCSDDFNRVVLKTLPKVEHSDYINASYVDVRGSLLELDLNTHYCYGLYRGT